MSTVGKARKFWAFVGAYLRANLAMALEYRASFFSQVFGMFINDILWVAFWVLYFTQFPVLRGWTLEDVLVLWSSLTLSMGLVLALAANAVRLPQLVVLGQLDYYLALPKDVLVHLLISQIRPVNFGDVLFGPVLLVAMVDLTWSRVAVFLAATLLGALVALGFFLLIGSLVFFLGNSTALSGQLFNALLHFSSYPTTIFDNAVKLLLFTVLPAGFVTTMPVELVREFHWMGFVQLLAAACVFLGLGVMAFRLGLRRYESGNLMIMRS